MGEIDPYTVVKWIFIVLAAAFVGQFGKTFAQYLIRKARERAAGQKAPAEKPVSAPSDQGPFHPGMTGEGKGMQTPVQGASNAASYVPDEKTEKKLQRREKKNSSF
ncbi:MAG: hypothetical protein H6Q50_342 [Deltaproteobacteria bacterium]|nr:hypothetical protein [Deltaproteobacteria bacterium]